MANKTTADQIDALRIVISAAHTSTYTPSLDAKVELSKAYYACTQAGCARWEIHQATNEHMDDADGGEAFLTSLLQ